MAIVRRHPAIVALIAVLLLIAAGVSFGAFRFRRTYTSPILETWNAALTTTLTTSVSSEHGVRLQPGHRGVNLDGSVRAASHMPLHFAGNPFENAWSAAKEGELNLGMGTYAPDDVDLALPAVGFSWPVVGRTYNDRMVGPSGNHRDGGLPQGTNWMQTSMPEIQLYLYNGSTPGDNDVLYMFYGADRFLEYHRVDIGAPVSNEFKGTNGTVGTFKYVAGGTEPDTYTLYDGAGYQFVFFGFDSRSNPAKGRLWKITDPANNVAFVGDATTGSTAITNGFNSSGYQTKVYDTSDRRWTYTYTTLDSIVRLTQVKAETKTSGSWSSPSGVATVGTVDYAYYTNESNGDIGDLKLVTKTIPQTDSGIDLVQKVYYRYWEGTYNSSTNPGYPHSLKLVLGEEGCRNFDWQDTTFDEDFKSASQATLEPYAEAYLEYDSSYRVNKAWFHGSCGCSGASAGTYEYSYGSNGSYTDNSGYDTAWCTRTVVKRPDGSYRTVYFDEALQPLASVVTDIDPASSSPAPQKWVTAVTRDSMGCVTEVDTPASVTGYTHSTGAITVSTSAGLINTFVRVSSGCDKGFVSDKKWKQGTSGTAYLDGSWTYDTATAQLEVTGSSPADTTIVRPFLSSKREYTTAVTSGTSGSNLWNYSTSVYSGKLAIEKVETTQPAVSTGNNGSNSAVVTSQYFNTDGTLAFEKSGTGRIDYTAWSGGQVSKKIQDADTTKTAGGQDFNGVTIPSGFSSSGTPFHMKTTYAYDAQGRSDTTTVPSGRIEKNYFSRLADHRQVSMHIPAVSGSTKYSPASYNVTNHAGKSEFSGTVGFASGNTTAAYTALIDETDADPITALDTGTVTRMSTSVMDDSGTRVEESRDYFLVPASGAGADGTNYDPTFYKYDDSGRVIRTLDPTGTISATVFDAIGRKLESWLGKNDADVAGADDMVKINDVVYDSGSDGGNSLVTKSTQYIQDSGTGKRETSYSYDVRGNTLLVTNPLAPHHFNKYDNLNRMIASGSFSSTGSITLGSDDPTTETTNRLSLSQTFYDERGQVWKSQGHKIDESDGSDDDNLQTLTWYDADGRQVKQDGAQLTKTAYDSLGRAVDSFVLATDNDASYSDVSTVTGDVVVEQQVRGYNPTSGLLELETTISRFHDDVGGGQTTGALDTNADNDRRNDQAAQTKGRANIVGTWYDANLDRPTNKVAFGTNNGSDYDRGSAGSAPGSTDVILGSSTTYNTDGTVDTVTDPKGRVTKYTYDAMGRKTKEIRNYNSGVNSGNPYGTDDNVTTAWEYTDGNMTKLKAMLPGGGSQDTTYAYGVTKGASAGDSKISSGHLLHTVTYPDGGGDVVTYAYNAQGQMTYKLDQAGNVHDYTMDDLGRQTKDVWSTNISGFDTAVRRIESTYQSDGRPQLVTQYDATSAGNVVDEVKYLYDSWGNISDFQYDRDSAVGASPDNKYAVSYAYAKSTTGRNSVRKTSMTMPSGQTINYEYSSSSSLDDAMSRVTDLKQGAQILAQYEYNGAGMVVGTTYPEPGVSSKLHKSTSGVYDALDRFNRVIESRWTKDSISKEFYDVAITWDRTNNPTVVDDKVQTGFDVQYTMDDLDRVTRAEEGTWNTGPLTLTSRTRDQQWTLSHTGNWDREKLDLNGDGDFVDTNEHDDTRTHDAVNQLNARDTDSNASNNYSLTYDADGNLTDDAENYKYVYDGWGRLRYIKKTSNSAVVAEYKYNGLGFRTAQHEDTDADLDVDSSDKWYYLMYDERWRHLSTFRETDSGPKEEFVPHQAGADGMGGSSYVDLLVCRERDESSSWTSASDGTCEIRIYYCQNWRADVSAIVSSGGAMIEWVKYSAYGVPFGLPRGDTDSNGETNAVDLTVISGWTAGYDVRCDVDMNGTIDGTDASNATAATLGRVANTLCGNRTFYEGVVALADSRLLDHRNRVRDEALGGWTRRDPLEYVDGLNLLEVMGGSPVAHTDPFGLTEGYWLNWPEHVVIDKGPYTFLAADFSFWCNDHCHCQLHASNDPVGGLIDSSSGLVHFPTGASAGIVCQKIKKEIKDCEVANSTCPGGKAKGQTVTYTMKCCNILDLTDAGKTIIDSFDPPVSPPHLKLRFKKCWTHKVSSSSCDAQK